MSTIVAVPSCFPGGLEANMGMHFGHCDIYTIAEVEDGMVVAYRTLETVPHHHGGCMAPVEHLAKHGVKVLLAGGMGMRPLMACQQLGIDVQFAGNFPTVGAALKAYAEGRLQNFTSDFTCGGGHHHG
jgi:predicted Fe-Mo cluster-binding NifX family protein